LHDAANPVTVQPDALDGISARRDPYAPGMPTKDKHTQEVIHQLLKIFQHPTENRPRLVLFIHVALIVTGRDTKKMVGGWKKEANRVDVANGRI